MGSRQRRDDPDPAFLELAGAVKENERGPSPVSNTAV